MPLSCSPKLPNTPSYYSNHTVLEESSRGCFLIRRDEKKLSAKDNQMQSAPANQCVLEMSGSQKRLLETLSERGNFQKPSDSQF